MKRLLPIAFCLCFCAACAGTPKKQKPKTPEKVKPVTHRSVGNIVAVNEAAKFVLIDTGVNVAPDTGDALKSFSGGKETGVLTVSPEHKPPFIIGDIVGGSPQKGDEVFQ